MALLTRQAPSLYGTTITYAAATAGGDTFGWIANGVLRVKNGSASSITVTVVVPGSTYGQANPDVPVVVAAGVEVAIGTIPGALAVDGVVSVSYTAVTTVTVAYA